jgi:hypothetical protein
MPLTKANSVVLDVSDLSLSMKQNGIEGGVKDYIDDSITQINANTAEALDSKSDVGHTHPISDIDNLQTTLNTLKSNTKEFKNKIINGSMRVAQKGLGIIRSEIPFTINSTTKSPVDRFSLISTNTSGKMKQTNVTQALSVTHETLSILVANSPVNGKVNLIHRISNDNIKPLSGYNSGSYKNATFSCKIQNTYSQNLSVVVRYKTPTDNNTLIGEENSVLDNFADGLTLLGESSSFTINANTTQNILFTESLQNCYGGLQVELEFTFSNQVVNNTTTDIKVFEVQLEEGSVKTDFEIRSFEEELRDCLRYYEVIGSYDTSEKLIGTGFVSEITTRAAIKLDYITKRKIPTINIIGALNDFSIFNDESRKPSIGSISSALIGRSAAVLKIDTLIQIVESDGLGHPTFLIQKINKTSFIEIDSEL